MNLISFGKCLKEYRISKVLIEYLELEIISKGRAKYISEESLNKALEFKNQHSHKDLTIILSKYTCMKKYGVENPQQSKEIKEKTNKTIKEKYGVNNISQSKEIKEEKIKTLKEHYGNEINAPTDIPQVVESIKKSWKNKTDKEIKNMICKIKQTKLEKYGDENYNNAESISKTKSLRTQKEINDEVEKSKKTRLEKYGNENYNNANKIKRTCLKKYGEDNVFKTENFKNNMKLRKNNSKKDYFSKGLYVLTDVAELINRDYSTLKYEIMPKLNIDIIEKTIEDGNNKYLISENDLTKIKDYCSKTEKCGTSYGEKEIVEFIKSIFDGEVLENDRKMISPKELDIYIPSKKIAIEFDGVYWHSEQHLIENGITDKLSLKKMENDLLNKTILCEEKGIRLIHILDIDWFNKKDIYKSLISSSLGIYDTKIFARKCKFERINNDVAYEFLKNNHVQSYAKCTDSFGLFYNDELIQCMTFNKKSIHNKKECELNRMVTKRNTQVVGGFSKLLKNSIKELNVKEITSYIDRSIFNGIGYYTIGFKNIKINPPTYKWYYRGKLYRREFSMKKNQQTRFTKGEQKYFDKDKTEVENMLENEIPRIWNCGTIKVKYQV